MIWLITSVVYGSTALTTEINQVDKHLSNSGDTVFASEFSIALGGNFSFSTELGEGDGTVGFLPNSNIAANWSG